MTPTPRNNAAFTGPFPPAPRAAWESQHRGQDRGDAGTRWGRRDVDGQERGVAGTVCDQVTPHSGDTDSTAGTRGLQHGQCQLHVRVTALWGHCQHQHIDGHRSLGTPLSPVTRKGSQLWGHRQHWHIHGHGSFGTSPASVTHESHGSLGTPVTTSDTQGSRLSGDSTGISTYMGTALW